MTSLQPGFTHLPIHSDLGGTVTDIQNDDSVILLIESRVSHRLEIQNDKIRLIFQDHTVDAESFTLQDLLDREVSIFRTEKDYRILVKEDETARTKEAEV